MKFTLSLAGTSLVLAALAAGPKVVVEPVAEGYPSWQGLDAKNHLLGRELTPSDLRQRIVIVADVDAGEKLQDQVYDMQGLFQRTGQTLFTNDSVAWEHLELPREVMLVFSVHGAKDPDVIKKALSPKSEQMAMLTHMRMAHVPFYGPVSFEGGPDTNGKRPYVYVLGFDGKVLGETSWTDPKAGMAMVAKAIAANRAALEKDELKWRPFYGYVAEPKFFGKDVEKALAKGKPLSPVAAKIHKNVKAKDPEKAKEAQIIYDAIMQEKSDLVFRIRLEAARCPHRAAYDVSQLTLFWPEEKKKVADALAKIKANPEAGQLAKFFTQMMKWSDPDFVCKNEGEAKKIVGELNKIKAVVEKLKESKNIVVQNGALLMDGEIDELISIIPNKLPVK